MEAKAATGINKHFLSARRHTFRGQNIRRKPPNAREQRDRLPERGQAAGRTFR